MSSHDLPLAELHIPAELLDAVDSLVGADHRTQFLIDAVREKVRLQTLLGMLDSKQPLVSDEDHPEWAKSAAEWVRNLRHEGETHLRDNSQQ